MVNVQDQYEAYPYPERDPAQEKKRLITGSPSQPLEIDHFCFQGVRDWARPFRALVAGGGTGDGLIQLAQVLSSAGRPYEITYIDLSSAARAVAEARARVRGLTGITFHTGSLLDAADLGRFDYIDCCGVLHHLPEPEAGFAALRQALAEGGALGLMVYAPLGRTGVYPLQEAFGTLFKDLPAQDRLSRARAIVKALPEDHPFKRNRLISDHEQSDAGFYDLLLHSQDRSYDVAQLNDTLISTGWELLSFTTPALYDLARFAPPPDDMDRVTRMALAEKLTGTIRVQIAYAVPQGDGRQMARGSNRALIPHLRGVQPQALARAVAQGKPIPVAHSGVKTALHLPKEAAGLIAGIDGQRSLAAIAQAVKLDPLRFGALWARVERPLVDWGLMLYSNLLKR